MARLRDKKSLAGMIDLSGWPELWQKDARKEGYFHENQHRLFILIPFAHFRNRQKTIVWMTSVIFAAARRAQAV